MAEKVLPALPTLIQALDQYHLYSSDGWITTAGFLACCNKVGLTLLRSDFLALERSVPKDKLGRINYRQVTEVVEAVCAAGGAAVTAPEAVSLRRGEATFQTP